MSSEQIYAASQDVRQELSAGSVEGDKGYQGEKELREAIVVRSMRRATRVIDGILKKTYPDQVPWATSGDVPRLIRSIANDLSVYYVRRSRHPGPAPLQDGMKSSYFDEPMDLLNKIANREMLLSDIGGAAYPETYHTREDKVPVFDMDAVEDQEVDPDLLDDLSDERTA